MLIEEAWEPVGLVIDTGCDQVEVEFIPYLDWYYVQTQRRWPPPWNLPFFVGPRFIY